MARKYSPASGSVSVAQRSNMRYDLTYSSFQMFSHNWIWLAARDAGRNISNDERNNSGGTLPTLSINRSTSKWRLSEKFWNSFISRKSTGVVKQIRFFIGPSAKIEPYNSDSTPPKQYPITVTSVSPESCCTRRTQSRMKSRT